MSEGNNIFDAETPSDFCKFVEKLLQDTNQTSFEFTSEFTSEKGIVYDVHVSYTKRKNK